MEIILCYLTFLTFAVYNGRMKKVILGILVVLLLAVAGCGVKTSPDRPDNSFPRAYPVH